MLKEKSVFRLLIAIFISLLASIMVWLCGGVMAWLVVANIRLFDALLGFKIMPFGFLGGLIKAFTDFPPVFTYSLYAGIVAFPICIAVIWFLSVDSSHSQDIRLHSKLAQRNEEELHRLQEPRQGRSVKKVKPSQWLPK